MGGERGGLAEAGEIGEQQNNSQRRGGIERRRGAAGAGVGARHGYFFLHKKRGKQEDEQKSQGEDGGGGWGRWACRPWWFSSTSATPWRTRSSSTSSKWSNTQHVMRSNTHTWTEHADVVKRTLRNGQTCTSRRPNTHAHTHAEMDKHEHMHITRAPLCARTHTPARARARGDARRCTEMHGDDARRCAETGGRRPGRARGCTRRAGCRGQDGGGQGSRGAPSRGLGWPPCAALARAPAHTAAPSWRGEKG